MLLAIKSDLIIIRNVVVMYCRTFVLGVCRGTELIFKKKKTETETDQSDVFRVL